jgi:hypothetical protein
MWVMRLAVVMVSAVAFTALSRADPKPTTSATSAPAAGCTMKVKSSKVDIVSLRSPRSPPAGPSEDSGLFSGLREARSSKEGDRRTDQKLLVVEVEVTNAGREKCVYHSLAGSDEKCPTVVVLQDDAKHVYALANFGELEVVGALKGAKPLAPGESLTDVLVFEVPPRNAKGLRLLIPRENVGRKDRIEPLPISLER